MQRMPPDIVLRDFKRMMMLLEWVDIHKLDPCNAFASISDGVMVGFTWIFQCGWIMFKVWQKRQYCFGYFSRPRSCRQLSLSVHVYV